MEELTRVQENLALLAMHQAQNAAAGKNTLTAELVGLGLAISCSSPFPAN